MLDKFQIAHIGTLMAALRVQNWEATIIILKWLLDKFQISNIGTGLADMRVLPWKPSASTQTIIVVEQISNRPHRNAPDCFSDSASRTVTQTVICFLSG